MTLPIAVGAAGLIEAGLGFLTTSILTGGAASWDPFNPGEHKADPRQAAAEQMMRKALAAYKAEALDQTLTDIWTTSATQQAVWDTAVNVQTIADYTIPNTRAYAAGQAHAALGAAKSYGDARLAVNVTALEAAISTVRTQAHAELDALRTNVGQINAQLTAGLDAANARIVTAEHEAVADAEQYADAAIAHVQAVIDAELGRLQTQITQGILVAEHYADAAAGQAVVRADAYTDAALAASIAAEQGDLRTKLDTVWQDYATQTRQLEALLTQDDPAAAQNLQAVPDVAPASEAAAAVAAIAGVTALVRTAVRCTVPNCRNLSKLGRDLADLFKLVEGGLLLALLAELVHDPKGMAAELHAVLGPVISGASSAGRGLLGV